VTAGRTIILEGNLAQARNMAIANGKRSALEEGVRELIPESALFENYEIINENIYHRHERFIDTFRILSETPRENIYEVTLESVVSMEKLKNTLVSLGLMEEDIGSDYSRFKLEISGVSCPACFRTLKEYLQNKMEGVEEVSLYSIRPGKFTLDIVYRGEPEIFRDAIISQGFQDFRLDLEGMHEENLRVLMVLIHVEEG
jgi:hypothetical protein